MDDATQKLVDRVKDYPTITRLSHKTQIELIEQLRDALEAAQRPGATDDATQKLVDEARATAETVRSRHPKPGEWASSGAHDSSRVADVIDRLAAALEAAQRPPVSPEVRDAMRALRAIEVADRVDHSEHVGGDGEPCGVERSWGSRMGRDLAAALDALEAAQRPPVSPVLDAINDAREAVARGERPSIIIDTDDYPSERVA